MIDNLDLALELSTLGWLVFPCREKQGSREQDTVKSSTYTQHGYLDATTDFDQICDWWQRYPGALVGIACAPSGLFVLDPDRHPGSPDGVAAFEKLVQENGGNVPTLAAQATPGGGWHFIFSAPRLPADFKIPDTLAPGIDIKYNGYICSGALPDGRAYTWKWRPQNAEIRVYPPAWIAKMLLRRNETTADRKPKPTKTAKPGVLSPGDDYNARTDWGALLPAGWNVTGSKGEVEYLTRPGKGRGVSATIGYGGKDLLYVFSTNAAPFEPGKTYSKFAAYALLKHGGDFKAAAAALAAAGYGKRA